MARVLDLPPPTDFGAPKRFVSWRDEQVDAIERLMESEARFVCFNMPTGSGKSLTAKMAGTFLGVRSLTLTATKALQDQYRDTRLSTRDLRGQANYECLAVRRDGPLRDYGSRYSNRTMVDRGPCHVGIHCWMRWGGCEYFDAVRAAKECAENVTTNYDYWLAVGKSLRGGGEEQIGEFPLLVLDEAHAAVDKTCEALRIKLPQAELYGMLDLKPLDVSVKVEDWRIWAKDGLQRWGDEMDRVSGELRGQYVDSETIAEYKTLQQIGSELERVSELDGEWIVGESWKGEHVTFDPVWPSSHTEELLFRGSERVLLLSATITEKTLDVLGVPKEEREFKEYPSPFPVARRPIYILTGDPAVIPRVDFRMDEVSERQWMSIIDAVLGPRIELGWRGVIHCVSYARMKRIKQLSKYKEFFIVNEDATRTRDAISRFKDSRPGTVLVSPSVTTGEDFPDDECRYVLVPKLPFADSRDPIARARERDDPGYGGWRMMSTLTQSCGRHVRSVGDWGESIIVDGHAKWAMPKFKEHSPKYFRDAWRWVYSVPEPLSV
jgi:ATP-dependent DNA helicase DinG